MKKEEVLIKLANAIATIKAIDTMVSKRIAELQSVEFDEHLAYYCTEMQDLYEYAIEAIVLGAPLLVEEYYIETLKFKPEDYGFELDTELLFNSKIYMFVEK